MSHTAQDILDTILSRLKTLASTETVVGQPVQVGGVTVLPVIKLTVGFGAGGGEGKKEDAKGVFGSGGGGGGGASVTPVGFIVWDGQKVQFISLGGKGKLETLMETVPEILERVGIFKKDVTRESRGDKSSPGRHRSEEGRDKDA